MKHFQVIANISLNILLFPFAILPINIFWCHSENIPLLNNLRLEASQVICEIILRTHSADLFFSNSDELYIFNRRVYLSEIFSSLLKYSFINIKKCMLSNLSYNTFLAVVFLSSMLKQPSWGDAWNSFCGPNNNVIYCWADCTIGFIR